MSKTIFSGSLVTLSAVAPDTVATTIAGHRPRTARAARTGTNDMPTWPTPGRRISRTSAIAARMANATSAQESDTPSR